MRLRKLLADGSIRTDEDGYHIELEARQLDLTKFRLWVVQAAEAGDRPAELTALADGLALWREVPPLANIPSDSFRRYEVPQLVEQYLQALGRRLELELRLGRHSETVGELLELVQRYPFHERFWAQRIRALQLAGRPSEAVQAYHEVARLLADELGIDPGPEIRAAYEGILTPPPAASDPALGPMKAAAGRRPRQLPPAGGDFVGRAAQITIITDCLAPAIRSFPVPVLVITGPAGVGKTMLAVHVGHQLESWFPDGQLYADLRKSAGTPSVSLEEVLSRFLRAQGAAPETVPLPLNALISAYRGLTATKRILVVLDDVGSEAEVQAFLPASPGSAVMVTSQCQLTGLMEMAAVRRITLPMLSSAEGFELLSQLLGSGRVKREVTASEGLAELCGGLPLALRIAAAQLALRPQLLITDYVSQLRIDSALPEMLSVEGDHSVNLWAAFDWSYERLPPTAQRVLRFLSVVPTADVSVPAVAAMAGIARGQAAALERLAAATFLGRTETGRYQVHGLIRSYAAGRCFAEESVAERQEARRRLLMHYIDRVDAVVNSVVPVNRLVSPRPGSASYDKLTFDDLDEDRAAMVAAVRVAADEGPHELAYLLADALRGYFALRIGDVSTARQFFSAALGRPATLRFGRGRHRMRQRVHH